MAHKPPPGGDNGADNGANGASNGAPNGASDGVQRVMSPALVSIMEVAGAFLWDVVFLDPELDQKGEASSIEGALRGVHETIANASVSETDAA